MTKDKDIADVGIAVVRYQVPDLTEAHKSLLQKMIDNHEKVIIFLGLSPVHDSHDPLDFEARKQMILESFPNIIVAYIPDMPSDEVWSKKLDEQIGHLVGPNQSVTLYGGRDSFLQHYKGNHHTQELKQETWVSGTEIRKMVKNQVKSSQMFRHGAVWSSWQRFPTVFSTVDVAILNGDNSQLLLAKKEYESKWRFVGGFAQPSDLSMEETANRELREEVRDAEFERITTDHYIGSRKVDDWRYRGREDCIRTSLYWTRYLWGSLQASDDIEKVKWFDLNDKTKLDLVDNHVILFEMLMKHLADSQSIKEMLDKVK